MVQPGEEMAQVELICAYKYLMVESKENGAKPFPVVAQKAQIPEKTLKISKTFGCKDGRTLKKAAKWSWNLHPWDA